MHELRKVEMNELDLTQPGIYVFVIQGNNFAQMAEGLSDAMRSPQFAGLKLLHVVHGQEMRMNPLQPGQVTVTYSLMAIVERVAES